MSSFKIVTDSSKYVSFNYFIKKKYEAGLILFGWEVKAIRVGGIDISSGFIIINNINNIIMIGSVIHIPNFIFKYDNLNENRDRKLLLNKNEIKTLNVFLRLKSYTLIPSKIYWKDAFLKVEISLCIGKKIFDKRQIEKQKEWDAYRKNLN